MDPDSSSTVFAQNTRKNWKIEHKLEKIKAFRAKYEMEKIEQRLSAIRQFNLDRYTAAQGREARKEQDFALPSPPLPKQ
ncbi:MAG: hypothetical protein ACMZI0_06765 [Symbiopectobacterium sp.]|uniref:hypothetical protein n=1 Tax=Symbiopectobacterium sp. TaxID=2952789 RepID=UPI0039EA5B46